MLKELPRGMMPNMVGGLVVLPFRSDEEGLSATGAVCLEDRLWMISRLAGRIEFSRDDGHVMDRFEHSGGYNPLVSEMLKEKE
jgi:hypothetical protein